MPDPHNDMEALKSEMDILTFRAEAAERLAAFDKLIREAESSKRSLEFTARFLGIGTLGGILALITLLFTFDHYFNGKISAQMHKWNDLDSGLSMIHMGQWSDALQKFYFVYTQQITQSDEEYRSVLFDPFLLTLASTSKPIERSWEGQNAWYLLRRDNAFKAAFLSRAQDQWDEPYCNNMFLCMLKFESKPDSLDTIDNYLQTALRRAPISSSKAEHLFQLGMESLARHHIDDAKKYLEQASESDSSKFNPNDWVQCLNKFEHDDLTFKMWCRYTERMREESGSRDKDFGQEFAELKSTFLQK
jgi:hypothetical protein